MTDSKMADRRNEAYICTIIHLISTLIFTCLWILIAFTGLGARAGDSDQNLTTFMILVSCAPLLGVGQIAIDLENRQECFWRVRMFLIYSAVHIPFAIVAGAVCSYIMIANGIIGAILVAFCLPFYVQLKEFAAEQLPNPSARQIRNPSAGRQSQRRVREIKYLHPEEGGLTSSSTSGMV